MERCVDQGYYSRDSSMSYLVIQGLEVETPDLKELAKLSCASRIEGIGATLSARTSKERAAWSSMSA